MRLLPSILAAALLFASTLHAEERVLIALCENCGSPALVSRLEAELLGLGFRVERVMRERGERLETLSRRHGALAAVAVRERDIAIELWGEDPDSGATAFTDTVRIDPRRGKEVAALAAVETLRGRLLRLGVTPQTLTSELSPPPKPEPRPQPAPAPESRFGVLVAAGVGSGADGSPTGYGRLGVHYDPSPWFALTLSGSWQPIPHEVSAKEGSAAIRVLLLALEADVTFDLSPLRFGVGPGVGFAHVEMEGSAASGYESQRETVSSMAALVHGVAALEVVGPLALRADAELGLAMPQVVVRFAGRDVATWGRPFVLYTLGADLRF